jgi:hypothetical protein
MAKFEKGKSGNPGGRPKAEIAVRDLARQHTVAAIRALVEALDATTESVRVSAAQALLDRGWGKAPQTLSGEDGEGTPELVIRWLTTRAK